MKLFCLVTLLSLLSSNTRAESKQDYIWGRIVTTDKNISGISYKYFVYYEQNGKSQAYPVDTDKKEIALIIKKNVNQLVKIHGKTKEIALNIDGPKKRILVFEPATVSPLTLSELSIPNTVDTASSKTIELNAKQKEYDGGGIRISDKAANAMIYTGTAIILGTQIGKILSKKN